MLVAFLSSQGGTLLQPALLYGKLGAERRPPIAVLYPNQLKNMKICVKIPVFTRSGKSLKPIRERNAKALLRNGKAVLCGSALGQGIRYKLPTDEEVASREVDIGYDRSDPRGRVWRGIQPASSQFKRTKLAYMSFA
jgi:hypothetical protein